MSKEEIIQIIEYTLKEKLKIDENILKYSFYEIRLKYNLSEQETDVFLKLIRNKLENMNYNVYFTGAEFELNGESKIVEDNDLLIAIKTV